MKVTLKTIAQKTNKLNYFALKSVVIICLMFPAAAFSQGAGFLIDLGRRQGQTLTQSRTFSVGDLSENARKRIFNANRQNNFQAAMTGDLNILTAKRGNPFINFEEGKTLASSGGNLNGASPLALAAADFDADGTEDLAVVYASENGGFVSIRRGNVESIFPPKTDAAPSPFFSETREFEISLIPDFLAAGDFNGDGRADLLAAKRGFDSLILLAGQGDGNFNAPQIVELKGEVTAFAVGEINNFDNLPDVAVGIVEKGAPKILIFQSRGGAFSAEAEILKIAKPANALGIGNLNGDAFGDLIAASGDELILSGGRNLSPDAERGEIKGDRVSRRKINFAVKALALGDFAGDGEQEIALLSNGGEIFLAGKNNLEISARRLAIENFSPDAKLIAAKISTRPKTDLIVSSNNQMQIVSSDGENLFSAATFDASDAPAAVLPMRLNKDALSDLVVLSANKLEPSVVMTAPMSVITVNNSNGSGGTENGTTLLTAINSANNSPGLDEIQFNLPPNSPPISMNVALPAITDPITINGLSQTNETGEPLVAITINPNTPTDGSTLSIVAGNSTIRGLIVNSTSVGHPIALGVGGNNFIESNYIGTNISGTASSLLTTASGIFINNSSGNHIGGANTLARNVISGIQDSATPELMPIDGLGLKPSGVRISGNGSTSNLIQGNYIGLDKNGAQIVSNAGCGVVVSTAASGNVIGGATEDERNVISGNACGIGVAPPDGSTSGVVIENNFIGTDKDGATARGNTHDGLLWKYDNLQTISNGENLTLATSSVFGNVISGNAENGVNASVNGEVALNQNAAPQGEVKFLTDLDRRRQQNAGSGNNPLYNGNRIGTNAAGTTMIPNGGYGVALENFSALIEGNLISANNAGGISNKWQSANFRSTVEIAENYIGTDITGNLDFGNNGDGIYFEDNLVITFPESHARVYSNVISGNAGDGVRAGQTVTVNRANTVPTIGAAGFIFSSRSSGNSNLTAPTGNFIGTNAAGNAALPNDGNGIRLENAPAIVEGNLISANGESGIRITGETPFGNLIADNYIGTNAAGTAALGNSFRGIWVEMYSFATTESQKTEIYDNVISGNTGDGVFASTTTDLANNAAPQGGVSFLIDLARRRQTQTLNGATISTGNHIGTNAEGTAAIPNTGNGVNLQNAAANIEENLISGNGANGVQISQLSYQLGQLNANLIGTNANGDAAIANGNNGVSLNLVITLAESQAYRIADNLISGNAGDGIRASTTKNFAESRALLSGVSLLIDRRPPSGNLNGTETAGTGNYIGVNADGTAAIPNGGNGINLMNVEAIIEGNLISGNAAKGVTVQTSSLGQLNANRIGTNASGSAAIANGAGGVSLEMEISQTDDAYEVTDNLISGNNGDGIKIFPSSSGASQFGGSGVTVDIYSRRTSNNSTPTSGGNFIGTKADGVSALPNTGNGISVTNVPTKIGGATAEDGNVIAFNGANGVAIFGGSGNLVMNNPIFSNNLLEIDLNGDGLTPNDAGDADAGANNLQNYPILTSASSHAGQTIVTGTINTTPNTNLSVQFFVTSDNLINNGGSPFASLAVTSNALGIATFNAEFPIAIPAGRYVSATATTAATNVGNENNTSEFSAPIAVLAPTSATVTVAGRVLSPQGVGVPKAIVTLNAANGETRTTIASPLGYYSFDEVDVGETYVFNVRSKLYTFAPRAVTVNEEMTLDFTAEP
jgi:hypothetical protein